MDNILLKKVDFCDIRFLWRLRNDPDVYKYFKTNKKVKWKEHVDWIIPIMSGIAGKELFVVANFENPVGQVRIDYKKNKTSEMSVSIAKEFWGKGFAKKALKLAIKKIKKDKKTKSAIAVIHRNNIASQKVFEKLNFKRKGEKGDFITYILEL